MVCVLSESGTLIRPEITRIDTEPSCHEASIVRCFCTRMVESLPGRLRVHCIRVAHRLFILGMSAVLPRTNMSSVFERCMRHVQTTHGQIRSVCLGGWVCGRHGLSELKVKGVPDICRVIYIIFLDMSALCKRLCGTRQVDMHYLSKDPQLRKQLKLDEKEPDWSSKE